MRILQSKNYLLILIILILSLLGVYFFFYGNNTNIEDDMEGVVMTVNGVQVTEKDIENYIREVSRDRFEDNLSNEELRNEAIRDAVGFIVVEDYFNKRGIGVTQEEIESTLMDYVNDQPGAETKDDFFEIIELRGYSREEFLRNITLFLKNHKLAEIIAKDIEISDENILKKYEWYKEQGIDGEKVVLPPLEEVENLIRGELAMEAARDIITEELNKEGEMGEIIFFD